MFGATPRCPRCEKLVYAAEQILGPGRKFYHKPCLTCTSCKRRLDSYTLLEHDEQPYCKPCHLKSFGTRDLRHANLPYAPRPRSSSASADDASSPPSSPGRPQIPPLNTAEANNGLPLLRPNRVLSPISSNFSRPLSRPGSSGSNTPVPVANYSANAIPEESPTDADPDTSIDSSADDSMTTASTDPTSADEASENSDKASPTDETFKPSLLTNTGRPGLGNLPRTVPLSFDHSSHVSARHKTTQSLGSINISSSSQPPSSFSSSNRAANALNLLQQEGMSPLRQTPTGTRYGTALGAGNNTMSMNVNLGVHMTGTGASPRKWGGTTPVCPKCSKNVYFAEQVKAVGKTYHKFCLRCTECSTTLDSTKLRDHDGEPFCMRCYNKLHGPQGQGYALLGKAGG